MLRKLETGKKAFLDKNSIHYSRWIVGSAEEWRYLDGDIQMLPFVCLERTDETVTSYREVGKPALYQLGAAALAERDQRREECHVT